MTHSEINTRLHLSCFDRVKLFSVLGYLLTLCPVFNRGRIIMQAAIKSQANVYSSPFISTDRFSFRPLYRWMVKGISAIGLFYLTCPNGLENHCHVNPITGRVVFFRELFPK